MKDPHVVTVRIPKDLAAWVNEEFPVGFKQTFVLQCFYSLRHVMTQGELPPHSEYARRSSLEAIEKIASET